MTAIEWTDRTWNPTTGCSKVSPGCAHCYAETLSLRFGWSKKPWTPENAAENVVLHPERLDKPLSWRKPSMVFVNSMSDLFHEQVSFSYIRRVFLVMQKADRHTFQVLTKRPERMAQFMALHEPIYGVAPNIWLGTSIESARHTWRADVLREIPAAVKFISAEPLLGSLFERGRVRPYRESTDAALERAAGAPSRGPLDLTGIGWVIVGGESGPAARAMHPDWARELRDACIFHPGPESPPWGDRAPESPAFFFKQWGGRTPKSGGRLLDGREWSEYPSTPSTGRTA